MLRQTRHSGTRTASTPTGSDSTYTSTVTIPFASGVLAEDGFYDIEVTVKDKAELDGQLSSALKTIMAVSENYPDLKANQNFMQLSEELRNTENKIAFSRQFYNDTVTMYNTKLQVFPSNIIAGMFNFTPSDFFKTDSEEARHNVKVDFGSGNNN